VKAARNALLAAESVQSSLYASYLPNVAAFGHYQNADVAGLTGKELWSVGVGFQWRIYDGGLREANVREASAKIAEAQASLASTESNARKEVGQSLLELESARANANKAKEQRELAAENQRLVDVSYRAGSATAVEQADATAQLRNAEIGALTEVLNSYVAALRVLYASGGTLR
jgi:outer membrane protein TolC